MARYIVSNVLVLILIFSTSALSDKSDDDLFVPANLQAALFKEVIRQKEGGSYQNSESSLCANHTERIYDGITNKEVWALEIIDSWGKIPSGLLWLHLAALGNYEECLSVVKNLESGLKIQGKYCLASFPLDSLMKAWSKPETRMFMPSGEGGSLALQIGVCIPNSCTAEEVQKTFKSIAKSVANITINQTILSEETCYTNTPPQFRTIDWVAIALFTCVGLNILVCSIYEYIIKLKGGTGIPFLISFSVFSNGAKLFRMQRTKSTDVIECLHGIRSLSIIWVVFGHAYVVTAVAPNINAKHINEWLQTVYSMFLQTATISVDSFFLMSGLLVAWITMNQLQKTKGCLNIPLIYFHRYLRLTPVFAATILFCVSIVKYCGSGPYWGMTKILLSNGCEEYWWSALLYVQNYVNPQNFCVGHSWYLSVDTQLFLFSPFIMICLWKWGRKFIIVILILMISSIGYTFAVVMKHNFPLLMTSEMLNSQSRMELVYYPTHTRVSSWFVGILLGYFLHNIKNQRIHISKSLAALLWTCSCTIMGAIMFGPYPLTRPGATSTALQSAFYESLSRVSWSTALALVIFACHTGYGGIINSILSQPFWQPISRLSYCIYLSHLIIQAIVTASIKNDTHFSDFDVIHRFWGDFSLTVMVSIIMSLAFESPIVGIEKIIFAKVMPAASTSRQRLYINSNESINTNNQNSA